MGLLEWVRLAAVNRIKGIACIPEGVLRVNRQDPDLHIETQSFPPPDNRIEIIHHQESGWSTLQSFLFKLRLAWHIYFGPLNQITGNVMSKVRLSLILLLNIIGVGLFCSWIIPAGHGFWFPLDSEIFHFFNRRLITHHWFLWLVAVTNNRIFDAISLLCMGCLMLHYWLPAPPEERRRIIMMGFTMLISAVLLNQIGQAIPISRPSPSLSFTETYRVSSLINIPTKDASKDSFPGDHGLMLLIFCGYMLRYFGAQAAVIALIIFIVFILPRVMSGAHWFSDIAVGSLSLALVGLPWILITPVSDRVNCWLNHYLPGKKIPQ